MTKTSIAKISILSVAILATPAISFAGTAQRLHRAVRTERWRYIEWSGPEGGAALIDEQADAHERTNLVHNPAHTETIAKLKALLPTLPGK